MKNKHQIPNTETSKHLLNNLRRTRLEVREVSLELAEINARLEDEIRQKQLERVRKTLMG
ncbi:hypothetical protein PMG71_12685 [Roseofilum sp. BLCC_M154]|uniref:Uncharacterized protein n=1 Tax=Roseofilum acuticapitatum BLCC-M154 TaxID=3022444 RepID=A0ABT7AW49_9CYAN|nr:hypothetical protein [Roseofilum acuticapitatum]MDJ1170288.1 hypothetical protein [Roseofilum acuticapitatum BLCC-M154]